MYNNGALALLSGKVESFYVSSISGGPEIELSRVLAVKQLPLLNNLLLLVLNFRVENILRNFKFSIQAIKKSVCLLVLIINPPLLRGNATLDQVKLLTQSKHY